MMTSIGFLVAAIMCGVNIVRNCDFKKRPSTSSVTPPANAPKEKEEPEEAEWTKEYVNYAEPPEEYFNIDATERYEIIAQDYPDFDFAKAESVIDMFMREYLEFVYGFRNEFSVSNINTFALSSIPRNPCNHIAAISIEKIVIGGYTKTDESAAITYRVFAKYAMNGTPHSAAYKITYAPYLKPDEEVSSKCNHCGAQLNEMRGVCPYCDTTYEMPPQYDWKINAISQI